MNLRRLGLSALALSSFALLVPMAGCMAGPDDSGDSEDALNEEVVGEAESAFGEAACGTDTANPDVLLTNTWPQMFYQWKLSSTLPYGDSTCTEAFRVQHTNAPTAANNCTFKAKFNHNTSIPIPVNQMTCEASFVESQTYDVSGNPIGSPSRIHGFWQAAGVCSLPGTPLNGSTTSSSGTNMRMGTAWAKVATFCFIDVISHKQHCSWAQDGVQTLTSCSPLP